MAEIIRRGRSAEAWGEFVVRQARSGLSAQAFCRQEGISAWSFYGWRARLRASKTAKPRRTAVRVAKEPAQFIEVGALQSSPSRCEIRLELGGGMVLQVVRG